MAQALGLRFAGAAKPAAARDLDRVTNIDWSGLDPRLANVKVVALADVTSPLTGPRGAGLGFAPQKGASPEEARAIDAALARFAELVGSSGNADSPGAGAAGGLGFGLVAFAGARLVRGAAFVLDMLRFDERARGCNLVITAEGRIDEGTLEGKIVCEVARRAPCPVVAIAGSVDLSPQRVREMGLCAALSLVPRPMSEADARADAARLLSRATEHVVALFRR